MKLREMFMGLNEGPQCVYWIFTSQPVWFFVFVSHVRLKKIKEEIYVIDEEIEGFMLYLVCFNHLIK